MCFKNYRVPRNVCFTTLWVLVLIIHTCVPPPPSTLKFEAGGWYLWETEMRGSCVHGICSYVTKDTNNFSPHIFCSDENNFSLIPQPFVTVTKKVNTVKNIASQISERWCQLCNAAVFFYCQSKDTLIPLITDYDRALLRTTCQNIWLQNDLWSYCFIYQIIGIILRKTRYLNFKKRTFPGLIRDNPIFYRAF